MTDWVRERAGASRSVPAGLVVLSCLTLNELNSLWRITERDLRAVVSVADTLAVVQRRARLFDELDRRARLLTGSDATREGATDG